MQRKAVSKGGDSYEYKIQLLYQIHDKESSSHQFMAQRACWALQHNPGTGISSVPRREMKPLCREGVPAPKPALVSQPGMPWVSRRAAPWPTHLSRLCFSPGAPSSRGDESLLGPARLRGQSRVSRREPASYGVNILINFNTDAQMRVNHSAAVLSNLPSLFIKTFLPELWLNVMLLKGPLKQPGGFSGCCWNTFYNLLCKEECESVLGDGWGSSNEIMGQRLLWKAPANTRGAKIICWTSEMFLNFYKVFNTVHMMLMVPFVI